MIATYPSRLAVQTMWEMMERMMMHWIILILVIIVLVLGIAALIKYLSK